MKMWILTELNQKILLHLCHEICLCVLLWSKVESLDELFHCGLGLVSYTMHFCCSPLSIQKISFTWPSLLRELFNNFGDAEECPLCMVASPAGCQPSCVSGSTFHIFAWQNLRPTVFRNDQSVFSKCKNSSWMIFRCLEPHCVCDRIEFIHFTCWTSALGPSSLCRLYGLTPEGSVDRNVGRGGHELGNEENCMLLSLDSSWNLSFPEPLKWRPPNLELTMPGNLLLVEIFFVPLHLQIPEKITIFQTLVVTKLTTKGLTTESYRKALKNHIYNYITILKYFYKCIFYFYFLNKCIFFKILRIACTLRYYSGKIHGLHQTAHKGSRNLLPSLGDFLPQPNLVPVSSCRVKCLNFFQATAC